MMDSNIEESNDFYSNERHADGTRKQCYVPIVKISSKEYYES